MDLFLQAQDIHFITVGLVTDGQLIRKTVFSVPPELYLKSVNDFLQEQHILFFDLKRIIVVNGPGSFTASRISVMIGNTLSFALNIPIFGVSNPNNLSSADVLQKLFSEPLPEAKYGITPVYNRPPRITVETSEKLRLFVS